MVTIGVVELVGVRTIAPRSDRRRRIHPTEHQVTRIRARKLQEKFFLAPLESPLRKNLGVMEGRRSAGEIQSTVRDVHVLTLSDLVPDFGIERATFEGLEEVEGFGTHSGLARLKGREVIDIRCVGGSRDAGVGKRPVGVASRVVYPKRYFAGGGIGQTNVTAIGVKDPAGDVIARVEQETHRFVLEGGITRVIDDHFLAANIVEVVSRDRRLLSSLGNPRVRSNSVNARSERILDFVTGQSLLVRSSKGTNAEAVPRTVKQLGKGVIGGRRDPVVVDVGGAEVVGGILDNVVGNRRPVRGGGGEA